MLGYPYTTELVSPWYHSFQGIHTINSVVCYFFKCIFCIYYHIAIAIRMGVYNICFSAILNILWVTFCVIVWGRTVLITPVLINALLFFFFLERTKQTINCFALPNGNRDEDSDWRTFNDQICPLLNDLNCIHYHVSF